MLRRSVLLLSRCVIVISCNTNASTSSRQLLLGRRMHLVRREYIGTVNCNDDKNNTAEHVRVNHSLLVFCIALAALCLMVNGDQQNAGGCIINGGNQSSVTCSNDTDVVKNAAGAPVTVDLRWLAFLCIMLTFVVGADDTAGGCIINGGAVNNLNCSGNTQNDNGTSSTAGTSDGLSGGEIAGIAIGAVSAVIALLSLWAAIANRHAVIGPNRIPLGYFKRAPLYRVVEGCTLLFGCGTLPGLEAAMAGFVQRGAIWSHWVPPEYPGRAIQPEFETRTGSGIKV